MKLLGIASFFLVLLCVCTVGGNVFSTSAASTNTSSSTAKSEAEGVISSQATTTSRAPVLTTTRVSATVESITIDSKHFSPSALEQTTRSATTQPPVKVTTTAADRNDSATNAPQESGTQLTQNGNLDAASTKTQTFSSTISLQKNTSAPGTSSLHMSSLTELTTFSSPGSSPGSSPESSPGSSPESSPGSSPESSPGSSPESSPGSSPGSSPESSPESSPGSSPESSPESSPGNKKVSESTIHYSTVILPIVITLIVITLSVFSLVALYRMCQKKTPEGQENGTEQAQSDKEGVKLLSVKTTSPETVFVEVRDICEVGFSLPSANLYEPPALPPSGEVSQSRTTGEHSSQGKTKTRQLFSPQQ